MSKHFKPVDAEQVKLMRPIADAPEHIKRAYAHCVVIQRAIFSQHWNKATVVRRMLAQQVNQNRNRLYAIEGGLADDGSL